MSSWTRPLLRGLVSVRGRAALGLGVVLAVGATHTFAYWTDGVQVTGTTFTSGSIDLKVNDSTAVTGYSTLNLPAMVPGSSTAGILTVSNSGSAPLKWTAATTATNSDGKNVRSVLLVKVTADSAVTGSGASATCAGSPLNGSATSLNGPLISSGRLLAAGKPTPSSEKICVQVTLPASLTDSSFQGATTDVAFAFTGTSDLS